MEPQEIASLVLDKNDLWNQIITPFKLPSGFELVMGDVCGGSSSTSMVLHLPLLIVTTITKINFYSRRAKLLPTKIVLAKMAEKSGKN